MRLSTTWSVLGHYLHITEFFTSDSLTYLIYINSVFPYYSCPQLYFPSLISSSSQCYRFFITHLYVQKLLIHILSLSLTIWCSASFQMFPVYSFQVFELSMFETHTVLHTQLQNRPPQSSFNVGHKWASWNWFPNLCYTTFDILFVHSWLSCSPNSKASSPPPSHQNYF